MADLQVIAQTVFVGLFGLAAVWFGVIVFTTASMVRSAFALLFSQAAIGAMFLAMQTGFLGVLQIMMMATEMSIMAIFMVMYMMDPGGLMGMDMTHQKRLSKVVGILGAFIAGSLVFLVGWGEIAQTAPTPGEQVALLGEEIMGRSMIIFETAGITILTAMVAATAIAVERRK